MAKANAAIQRAKKNYMEKRANAEAVLAAKKNADDRLRQLARKTFDRVHQKAPRGKGDARARKGPD